MLEKRKLDSQGRVVLPSSWRKKLTSNEVIITEDRDVLIIFPDKNPDLSKYIDAFEEEIPLDSYSDYHELKRLLLG